jgi:hypothetical protein
MSSTEGIAMNLILGGVVVGGVCGTLAVLLDARMLSAKLEAPPANRAAKRYRVIAFCSFMAFSALLLTAALVETLARARPVSETLGWSGIACLQVCAFCAIRYAAVNRVARPRPSPPERIG